MSQDLMDAVSEVHLDRETIQLAPLPEREIVAVTEQWPKAEIATSRPIPYVEVLAPETLSSVIRNLLSNAIRHNNKDVPKVMVDVPVWGEIGVTVSKMLDRLNGDVNAESQREELAERWAIWCEEKATRRAQIPERGINYATAFDSLTRIVPDDAIIPVDVGNNTYAFGRYFEPEHQPVLMSGYLGSIGFAFPAALGAWAATQEEESPFAGRKVVSVSSDGGFGQYMSEFTTAVKYNMDITHVLLNDDELGKISKEQRTGGWDVWQTDLVNPNFAAFADNCGGLGVHVDDATELDDSLERAIAHDGPALVEILTDSDPV
ncbi:MAG: thiamine pyrophosphate-dependent enzyme [Natronomonas sp.]